ncbi:alpha/beta fold hydrolase [Leptospira yasudae]|uniref:alpha/beta fold hydrolase n=1 Tax=Leptospira yasudae TaxID=2202201 RepID=UPI001FEFEE0D|nr:alpha/beta hydrolase [Leptospira yasudae]
MMRISFFHFRTALLLVSVFLSSCKFLGIGSIPIDVLKSKYANSESQFLQIGNVNLHFRDEGKGPAVILLHGVCASLHTWDDWVASLKGKYRIIRIDLPGHGLTSINGDLAVLDPMEGVKLLEEFRKRLGLEKFHLVGNSMGGYISWNYSLSYPNRVEKMVLIDAAGYPQPLPELIAFGSHPLVQPVAKLSTPSFLVSRGIRQAYGDPSKLKEEVEDRYVDLSMREGNREAIAKIFQIAREKFTNEEISARIKDVQTPTLVMWGTEDHWLKYEYFPNWKRDLKNAKFAVYEGAGHIPMEEIPDRTAKDLDSFLSGVL